MKRLIVTITIGFIIGIIYGLYFKTSIALFYGVGFIFYVLIKNFIKTRCLKIFITKQIILAIIISSIISNTYLIYINYKYSAFYNNIGDTITTAGVVVSDPVEKDYNYQYVVKSTDAKYKDKKFLLYIKKNGESLLKYGDLIEMKGDFGLPDGQRNYGGFNYREYLKSKGIYGNIFATSNNISVIAHNKSNIILGISNNIKRNIIEKINEILPDRTGSLLAGVLIRGHIKY
ncbi:MAG: DUF4131 domain-containing protein [Firmicutes bacterium]|nr:DUF4131 domain-containing protein [Bacillota bacterium]